MKWLNNTLFHLFGSKGSNAHPPQQALCLPGEDSMDKQEDELKALREERDVYEQVIKAANMREGLLLKRIASLKAEVLHWKQAYQHDVPALESRLAKLSGEHELLKGRFDRIKSQQEDA